MISWVAETERKRGNASTFGAREHARKNCLPVFHQAHMLCWIHCALKNCNLKNMETVKRNGSRLDEIWIKLWYGVDWKCPYKKNTLTTTYSQTQYRLKNKRRKNSREWWEDKWHEKNFWMIERYRGQLYQGKPSGHVTVKVKNIE